MEFGGEALPTFDFKKKNNLSIIFTPKWVDNLHIA
jgi:hypothetical protein